MPFSPVFHLTQINWISALTKLFSCQKAQEIISNLLKGTIFPSRRFFKSFPTDTGQLYCFRDRPGTGTIMGDHATCHAQGLSSSRQRQLVILDPSIKSNWREQTRLLTTKLIQSVSSHIKTTRPVEAMSPFFNRNLRKQGRIGKRSQGCIAVERSCQIAIKGFQAVPGNNQMQGGRNLYRSYQGGFVHRFNLRYSSHSSSRCASIHATAGVIRFCGRTVPASIVRESRATETREPSRKRMCT